MGIGTDLFSFFYMLTSSYAITFVEVFSHCIIFLCQKLGVHRWVFNLIPLVNLSIFMPVPSCFHYCSSVIELDVRDGDASASSFIIQDCFGYLGFLFFHMKMSIALLRCMKNCVGILMVIALNL